MDGVPVRVKQAVDEHDAPAPQSGRSRSLTIRGLDRPIPARDDETVLATIYRAGYAVRAGCHRGGCGICTVQILDGEVHYPVSVCEQALPAAHRAAGVALACRAVPVGDVTIEVPPEGRLRCIAPMLTRLVLGEEATLRQPRSRQAHAASTLP